MILFQWDSRCAVNIGEIDRQHQRLFALLDQLYVAIEEGHENEVVEKVLEGVLDYTVYHFGTEERLLHEFAYPEAAAHRAEHAKMTEQTKSLLQKLRADDRLVSVATLQLLCEWLNNHIMVSDRKFARFLIDKGVR